MVAQRGSAPFHIGSRSADPQTGRIALEYYFEGQEPFVEEIQLELSDSPKTDRDPNSEAAFQAAVRILHLLAGTSYYKSQAPSTLIVDDEAGITPAEAELVRATYDEGLREFATRNDLPIPLLTTLKYHMQPPAEPPESPPTDGIGRPLIPFGGGKDSTLVQHLLPEAVPVTVNPVSTHHVVAATLGHELRVVHRRLSNVSELTRPDRLNGHIPITAIVSAICVAFACLEGFTSVVMANERSASEPTLWTDDGKPVNHQYSKSAAFEQRFNAALTQAGVPLPYFSLLRELNEADIAAALAPLTDALKVLLSCNNAFAGSGTGGDKPEAEQRWCGQCPKCHFSFLMLAPHHTPQKLAEIFGQDLLADETLTEDVAALWDPDAKPWECVGERSEAAAAMVQLASLPEWSQHAVVLAAADSAADFLRTAESAGSAATQPTKASDIGETRIPEPFRQRVPSPTS